MIGESVAFLKRPGREVIYDAEHFFDGYRPRPGYALATLEPPPPAGADWLVLCDTNGGDAARCRARARVPTSASGSRRPSASTRTTTRGSPWPTRSPRCGPAALQVQGTINGYGERCGNLDLVPLVATLQLKLGIPGARPPTRCRRLTEVSPVRGRGGQPASRSPRAVRRTERVRPQGRHPRRRRSRRCRRAISTSIPRRSATRCAWW